MTYDMTWKIEQVRPDQSMDRGGMPPCATMAIRLDMTNITTSELMYFCLFGEVVQAGIWLEVPLCPGHVVVSQPYSTLVGDDEALEPVLPR